MSSNATKDDTPAAVVPTPACIHRLPQDVINKIAAGEIVVSPAAALKELLENSIDAGASSITVTARAGGAKLLQVTDNGSGILRDDLPLLCERHATSKLRSFEDLQDIATFGFRGEALASVSHVARVSVVSKTAASKFAYSAKYLDGQVVGDVAPSAGIDGTTISVEDLFYNLPTRLRALRSSGEEYRGVVDIVSRYAIKYAGVAFICRRFPERSAGSSKTVINMPDVRTEVGASVQENIRAAFGSSVADELLELNTSLNEHEIRCHIRCTKPGFSMKKGVFILFINGRLVNCNPLKRAVNTVYSAFLPRNGRPFVCVDLNMRQKDIDVNIHPNKSEVRFLHETEVVEAISAALESQLRHDGRSRTFLAQSLISDARLISTQTSRTEDGIELPQKRDAAALDKAFDNTGEKRSKKTEMGTSAAKPYKVSVESGALRGDLLDVKADDGHDRTTSDPERDNRSDGCDGAIEDSSDVDFANAFTKNPTEYATIPRGRQRLAQCSQSAHKDRHDPAAAENVCGGQSQNSSASGASVDTTPLNNVPTDVPRGTQSMPPTFAVDDKLATPSSKKGQKVASRDKFRGDHLTPSGAMSSFIHKHSSPAAVELRRRSLRTTNAPPMLSSIAETIQELRLARHRGIADTLREHIFVGVVSDEYVLIQYQTKLMLVETAPVLEELLYRRILSRFADFDTIALEPSANLEPLVQIAIADGLRKDINEAQRDEAKAYCNMLVSKAPMLQEYFSIFVSGQRAEDAKLERIPSVFAGMLPDVSSLPEFLNDLCHVDWTTEKLCLTGISRALARWYSIAWKPEISCNGSDIPSPPSSPLTPDTEEVSLRHEDHREWYLRYVLFESLRSDFDPPPRLANCVREITSTRRLYRIFERC